MSDVSWVVNDVRAALTDARYSVASVADPRTVPAVVTTDHPDAVLIDFQIGSMGGMAVTRSIRDAAATRGTPRPVLILLLDRDVDGFLAGRSGADAWIRKPFSADALRAAIDGLLAGVAEPS